MTTIELKKYLVIISGLIILILGIIIFFPSKKNNQSSKSALFIEKSFGPYSYENTTNIFHTYFKDSPIKESSVSFKIDHSEISFYTPQEQSFGILNPSHSSSKENTVTYSNIFNDTDLKYTIFSNKLLEEFIISTQFTASKFTKISQIATVKNIDGYENNPDGSISFYYQNQIKFILPRPVIYELSNTENNNYGIRYIITEINDNSYKIDKIITNEGLNWLVDTNRHYPIAIDLVINNADTVSNWTSSSSTYLPIYQDTTTKYEGTGSVKAVATNLSSNGTSADGNLTFSGTFNMNSSVSGSRSYADGIAYRVNPPSSGAWYVTRYSASDTISNGIAAGDTVLLINLQGSGTDTSSVGYYEIMEVESVSASQINFVNATTNSYTGTSAANQNVVIQRIPNYNNVTLDSTDILTASAWNNLSTTPSGSAGYYTGIVAFRVGSTLSISGTAYINVIGLGYTRGTGGPATSAGGGKGGESFCGTGGGSGGIYNTYNGVAGICGGGGGGAGIDASVGSGGSGSSTGGAGGGGGTGGGNPAKGGGGAGAGYGTAASGAARSGVAGGTNVSGAGGAGASMKGAGGGGGGGTYGEATISKLFLGSGGGGGGGTWAGNIGGNGGNGGGIVLIHGKTLNIGGSGIRANGNNGSNGAGGTNYCSGGGGGGSGGSIKLNANQISIGTTLVRATGGSGGSSPNNSGTAGGSGRIRIESPSISGTSNPAASTSSTRPGNAINQTISLGTTAINLSSPLIESISFMVRSNKTGNQFQFQMGEVVNSELTFPFIISSSNTWEQKTWDLSGISSTSKDAITKFAFKILSNDITQNFHFDDIKTIDITLNAPSSCYLEYIAPTRIDIFWTDTNTLEAGYQIRRSVNGGSFDSIIHMMGGASSYSDTDISSATFPDTYQYRIFPYVTGPVYGPLYCETALLTLGTGSFRFEGLKMEGLKIN